MTVDVIGQIACRKHAGDGGAGGTWLDLDIATFMQGQLVFHQFGGRGMADGDEKAVAGHVFDRAGFQIAGAYGGDRGGGLGAQNLGDFAVPQHFDLGVFEQAVLHDLFGAQSVATVDQGDFGGEIGQKQRFFNSSIAATDHHDLFAAIEKPVAGGAGRDAEAFEFILRRQAQPFGLRPSGKDHRIGGVGGAAVGFCAEGTVLQIKAGDIVGNHLRPHRLGMGLHVDHQVRALNVLLTRPVFNLGGDGQLAAGLQALHQDRLQHRARGVDGGGVACGAGADDQNFTVARCGHGLSPESCGP